MALRMADGPVLLLPHGFDAYAGYVNQSGIGITYPQVVTAFPDAAHFLSITTDGSPAQVADVEAGAMSDWTGYPVGYCAVSNAMALVNQYGRPRKLWLAHYTETPHICGPSTCHYPGLTLDADGTQWHSASYDESLLNDNFFDFLGEESMQAILVNGVPVVYAASPAGHLLEFTKTPGSPGGWSVDDVTIAIQNAYPNVPPYLVQP